MRFCLEAVKRKGEGCHGEEGSESPPLEAVGSRMGP